MIFSVWAPRAEGVELDFRGERRAMTPGDRGWWRLDVPEARPGEEYAYRLDGGPARPDPRSMDQPHGVHGASRIVDHGAYQWRHPDFRAPAIASGVVYELHIGTFTPEGTLDGAIERLDHLASLGITHVELMPINAFDGERGWGYDGVAWFAPHRAYTGPDGPDAVKRFVDACHGRGLGVILDVVYNHLGPSGNYLAEFGDYFTSEYATPWGDAVNLDGAGSDETRRLICDNALMWLEDYRFDGLRLDAVHAFFDRSAVHLLEQMSREVRRFEAHTGRSVDLIAESDLNDPRVVRSVEAGGLGIDAQWSDDFHHALHAVLTGESQGYYQDFGSIAQLAKAWRRAFVHDGAWSAFRRRSHGRPPTGLESGRFLAYIQNHDQVGNRAIGDRLASSVEGRALELSAAMVILSPFVPMLFMGEEWGTRRPFQYFTDHQDPALARAVRDGRRREFAPFGWDPDRVPDPQDPKTLERSALAWDELDEPESRAMLDWHARLIELRRSHPDLAPGALDEARVAFSEAQRWLVAQRGGLRLAFNLDALPRSVPLSVQEESLGQHDAGSDEILLTNDPEALIEDKAVRLDGFGVAVVAWEGEDGGVESGA